MSVELTTNTRLSGVTFQSNVGLNVVHAPDAAVPEMLKALFGTRDFAASTKA